MRALIIGVIWMLLGQSLYPLRCMFLSTCRNLLTRRPGLATVNVVHHLEIGDVYGMRTLAAAVLNTVH